MVKIGIIGFGTVGSGVYELMLKNAESIKRKAGDEIKIKYILDIRDFSSHEEAHLFINSFDKLLADDEIKIIAEVVGGATFAYDYTKRALMAGKHVVTSNKELVATHGTELLKIAKEHGVKYLFEASVGGGIPIIRPLHQCLAANEITEISGILNGTTNFILTEMLEKNKSFSSALVDAQANGYAEANPAADVEGIDTCRKISILSSLSYGSFVDSNRIFTEGITKITLLDAKIAEKMGYSIKLIGYSKKMGDGKVFARVSPMLIASDNPLSGVSDVFNAILVSGDAIGEAMFYGRGAGKLPTASAVVADIIDISKDLSEESKISWTIPKEDILVSIDEMSTKAFIRTNCTDKDKLTELFGECEFYSYNDEIALITKEICEKDIKNALEKIDCISYIRVL